MVVLLIVMYSTLLSSTTLIKQFHIHSCMHIDKKVESIVKHDAKLSFVISDDFNSGKRIL